MLGSYLFSDPLNTSFATDFPNFRSISNNNFKSYVSKNLAKAIAEVMVRLSLEHNLEGKLNKMSALRARATVNVDRLRFKRSLTCKQIETWSKNRLPLLGVANPLRLPASPIAAWMSEVYILPVAIAAFLFNAKKNRCLLFVATWVFID